MTTFVLVPGAWLGSWVWKKTTPLLEDKRHVVQPITLTGMGDRVHLLSGDVGIETSIQDVLNVVSYEDLDDFVLVGHSFAGKVVAAVADRMPDKVRTILYLDAFRPKKVRTPQGSFDTSSEFGPSEGLGTPFKEEIVESIGKDVRDEDRRWLLSKATPWPKRLQTDPITLSEKFDPIKSAYIFCTDSGDPVDEILQGKWGKIEGPYKVIESGHWPMITEPEELVEDMIALTS
jgi:pimeloyl-ACP methyl ester carboxylesterase